MISVTLKYASIHLILLTTLIVLLWTTHVSGCSKKYCAPIISKCQLLDKCRCDGKLNTTCRAECEHCLDLEFYDCCSCLDICYQVDENLKSQTQHLEPDNSDVFDLLISEGGPDLRWRVVQMEAIKDNKTANCSMTFLDDCMNENKCNDVCLAAGAGSYRWFNLGCCECVSATCNDFGINQVRCRNCPEESDQVVDALPDKADRDL